MVQSTPEKIKPLTLTLDTYWVLGDQSELAATVTCAQTSMVDVRLQRCGDERQIIWQTNLSCPADQEMMFQVPVGQFAGGYYTLCASTAAGSETEVNVPLAIRQTRLAGNNISSNYLQFAQQTIDHILAHQSMPLGGQPDAPIFVTAGNRSERSYRSLGHYSNGRYQTYWFPEQPFEPETFRMDIDFWPILDRLADAGGDKRYRAMVDAMADAFVKHAFDPASGLAYLGEEADFDVARAKGVPRGAYILPKYKPSFSGNNLTLSIDRLWKAGPEQMHRLMRSTFLGLITDPQRMDYNRFCLYGFNDAEERHPQPPGTEHCAFDCSGGAMIHLWASGFRYTGDAQCLQWAQRMADKWQAVQHPDSGLIPNFFGAQPAGETPYPLPGQWAESRGAAYTAFFWSNAALQLQKRDGNNSLAAQLRQMAGKLARGIIRFAYDPSRRVFIENLNLDGTPCTGTTRYCFRTQAEKDAAVAEDPAMAQVFVWDGTGLYRNAPFWDHFAGTQVPYHLAQVAQITGDIDLIHLLEPIAIAAAEESKHQPAPFTDKGRWTFRASGQYIRVFLILHELTGRSHYLETARTMANDELWRLDQIVFPHWWRLSERAVLLDSLLLLNQSLNQSCEITRQV